MWTLFYLPCLSSLPCKQRGTSYFNKLIYLKPGFPVCQDIESRSPFQCLGSIKYCSRRIVPKEIFSFWTCLGNTKLISVGIPLIKSTEGSDQSGQEQKENSYAIETSYTVHPYSFGSFQDRGSAGTGSRSPPSNYDQLR